MKPETDDFLRVLGSNLRAGRLHRGMTLLQLAACSGYDREELSSLEDGAHDLRFESALSLCRALNLELPAVCGRFFQEQPEKKPEKRQNPTNEAGRVGERPYARGRSYVENRYDDK